MARFLLVVIAAGVVLIGAPTAVTTVLSVVALVVVAERLARTRGRSQVDTVLVGSGGTLITLILLGLALGGSGIGLRPASWAIALGGLGLLALAVTEYLTRGPHVPRPFRWPRLRSLPWALAVIAIVVGALGISVRATDRADVVPLQMAFGTIAGTSAQVVVSSERPSGELELRTQAEDGTSLSYPLFTVGPGRPTTASVVLPASGRFIITLNNPDQTEPLRSLILDR